MAGQPLMPQGFPTPLAPYSYGTKAGNVIYVAGMVALDADGNIVGTGDVATQTRCTLEGIKKVLEAGGGSLADVTFNSIFLKNLSDYAAMNAVYKEYFSKNPPARYCIQANLVKPEFLVEIASIAHL